MLTEKERLDKIAELKSEMRSMLSTAETEKRDFSAEEQEKFNALDSEARMHLNFFKATEVTPAAEKKEERKIHDIFAENLRNSIDSGSKVKIEVRANIPINSNDIADTVPVLFQDVIDVLTPALIIEKAGAKMLFNVQGTPTWPTVGDVEASWAGENVSLVDKSIDFGAIRAYPHRMGLKIKVSRRALNQSNLDLYNTVVKKIARSFAALLNKTMVSLTKVSANAPTGVFADMVTTPIDLSENPTLKEIVSLETEVMNSNIELDADGAGAYIISTAMRGKLKTTPIEEGNPKMLLEDGEMNGYPVIVTNYMDSDSIGFGFFEYSVISQFGDFNLIFDPITGAGENEVKFIGNTEVAITVLRPEAFVIGKIASV
jgi:HK97 family phage major capsid protein